MWEGVLTELSKVNAPSILLHEFNYYFNKAINQYINKRYNIYDVSQQTTDDLRVLKSEARIPVTDANKEKDPIFGATYSVNFPSDYIHLLNCICIYNLKKTNRCYDKGTKIPFAAKRLTGDSWSTIMNDYYNRPLPERPYYYIHNVNSSIELPTNRDTDMQGKYSVGTTDTSIAGDPKFVSEEQASGTNFDRVIALDFNSERTEYISTIERETAQRYGNASKVRCEIRYGYDTSVYELVEVRIDYIKAPQTIRLTKTQVDLTEDTSQILEFPDYVCQEILNELVILIMSRDADPRLQVQAQVTQSIANPVQQQAQQPQQRGS